MTEYEKIAEMLLERSANLDLDAPPKGVPDSRTVDGRDPDLTDQRTNVLGSITFDPSTWTGRQ